MATAAAPNSMEQYKEKIVNWVKENTMVAVIVFVFLGLIVAWFIWGRKSKYADRARNQIRSMRNKMKVLKTLRFKKRY